MTKVLLVDDENLILYSLSKTLRHGGVEVTAVTNGKDAMREIHRLDYDICFLDVQLPDANGLAMIGPIREASPHTAIMIMTATYLDDKQLQSLEKQGCGYLPKPFDLDAVLSHVQAISRKKRAAG